MKAWKVSKYTGKFPASFNRRPDVLESFRMVWKSSRWSGKFPDGLDRFQMIWTVSRWPGQFLDGMESFQMAWKVSRWPGNFLCLYKLSRFTKTFQVALLPCYLGFSASEVHVISFEQTTQEVLCITCVSCTQAIENRLCLGGSVS